MTKLAAWKMLVDDLFGFSPSTPTPDSEVRPTGGRGPLRADGRFHVWRKLDLIHDGKPFLRRRGVDLRWFGVLIHRIDGVDPGLDLHDHPWPFVSIVLRGRYTEQVAGIVEHPDRYRYPSGTWGAWLYDGEPDEAGALAADLPPGVRAAMEASARAVSGGASGVLPHDLPTRYLGGGRTRHHRRFSIHTMPLDMAHRIDGVETGTVTLVIRGPKSRRWGFFLPTGWVDWEDYDYQTRRPASCVSSKPSENRTVDEEDAPP